VAAKDLAIDYNTTSVTDGKLLDWSAVSETPIGLTANDKIRVGGQLSLNIADVVLVSTGFEISQSSVSGLDDPDTVAADTSLSGDLLTFSLEGADLFAGVGASLDTNNDVHHDRSTRTDVP
jgi:hypothetical protein